MAKAALKAEPTFEWADEDLDLLDIARLFERTIEYEIRASKYRGDDEGANLKRLTLHRVRAAIAKAERA